MYAWDPPCLSLGRAQPIDVVDEPALAAEGWDWVRRPTGGRALLHADELTYAVVAPDRLPAVAGGVLASYRELSRGLLAGLERLGLHPDPPAHATLSDADRSNPVCFEVPSAYEITVGGRKLIGSAQLRRRGVVLQHGSLPLEGDITRVARVLRHAGANEQRLTAERLIRHAVTLKDLLGFAVPWVEASRVSGPSFAQATGYRIFPDRPFSPPPGPVQQIEMGRYQVAEYARVAEAEGHTGTSRASQAGNQGCAGHEEERVHVAVSIELTSRLPNLEGQARDTEIPFGGRAAGVRVFGCRARASGRSWFQRHRVRRCQQRWHPRPALAPPDPRMDRETPSRRDRHRSRRRASLTVFHLWQRMRSSRVDVTI
jgi:lipoate-protein ligase A